MGNINFKKFLSQFEKSVIDGINKGYFDGVKLISVKNSPINSSNFARGMGRVIMHDAVMALDYYGYYKKSRGFFDRVKEERRTLGGRQLKMINCVVVHFNSIKLEDLASITDNVYVISNFAEFKKRVLFKRGFVNGS